MVFQVLQEIFFHIFVQSGLLSRIFQTTFKSIYTYTLPSPNHYITDDSGCQIQALKIEGMLFPKLDKNLRIKIKNLRIRETDILICGFPKTGCHWTYEILYMILNNTTELSKHGKIFGGMMEAMPTTILKMSPSPRILNTHVLYEHLPAEIKKFKTKIVFTERNVKDVVVSFYNHIKTSKAVFGDYRGTFNDYFKLFMEGDMFYGSFFQYTLNWYSAMRSQSDNEIFVLSYEDLKNDPISMVNKLAVFLGVCISDEFAEAVALNTSFNKMKEARPKVGLIRKGVVGDWTNWMTDEQVKQIDDKWEETKAQIEIIKKNIK